MIDKITNLAIIFKSKPLESDVFDLQDAIEEIEGRIDRLMQAENARHATRVLDLKTVRTRMIDEARAEWRKQT